MNKPFIKFMMIVIGLIILTLILGWVIGDWCLVLDKITSFEYK